MIVELRLRLLDFVVVIETVTVASHKAEFSHSDPLTSMTVTKDCHAHPELKRKLYAALAEGEEGELAIGIPGQVSLKQVGLLH